MGSALCVAYLVVGDSTFRQVVYHVLGGAVPLLLLGAVRRFKPDRPLPWLLLAAGTALSALADLVYDVYGWTGRTAPFPSVADALYLLSYPVLIAAFVVLASRAARGLKRWLLDSLILALAGTIVLYATLIGPQLDQHGDAAARVVTAAYPSLDAVLLLAVLPIAIARPANAVLRLLVAYGLLLLVGDSVYGIQVLGNAYALGNWVDILWLLGYVALGAGSLSPSFRTADARIEREADDWTRLSLLACALLVAFGVVAAVSASWDDDFFFVATGAGITAVLVLLRAALIYRDLRSTATRLGGETRRLAAVERVQRHVTAGRDSLEELLNLVCVETAALTGGAVSVALLDGDRLAIRGAVGSHHVVVGREMGADSIGRLAIERDDVVSCADLGASRHGDHDLARLTGTRSIAAAPLHFAGSPIGAVIATHPQPSAFDESVPKTLELMASLLSVAANRSAEFTARKALAEIVDLSEDAIIGQALDGAIVSWNAGAERMLGWTSDEMIGSSIELVVPEDRRGDVAARRRTVARGVPIAPFESERLTKDGRRIAVSLGLFPIRDDSGKVVGVSAIGRDLTSQKELEDQLHQAQKMEAIGRLAGGIAHDFNNLLLAIQGYGSMLRDRSADDDTSTRYAEQVLVAARRSAELTQQLLAYSRKQVLRPAVTPLNDVVAEIQRMLERMIGEDIALSCEFGADAGDVLVDSGRLAQVVMNLGVNARDAMPNGGRLSIATDSIVVAPGHPAVPPGTYARLSVSDTGTGMDDETRRSIFEPFFTTKEEGKGTGLGLATVQGTVTQSGGYITVDSVLGHGTVFAIYLPQCSEDRNESTPVEDAPTIDPAGLRVLLVEDQAAVRAVVAELLEGFGYEVVSAANPAEAIEVSATTRFDLLLTDMVMPGMSGLELAGQLRDRDPELQVLLTSGYPDGGLGSQRDLAFLQKPYSPRELRAAVDAAVSGAAVAAYA